MTVALKKFLAAVAMAAAGMAASPAVASADTQDDVMLNHLRQDNIPYADAQAVEAMGRAVATALDADPTATQMTKQGTSLASVGLNQQQSVNFIHDAVAAYGSPSTVKWMDSVPRG